MSCLTWALSIFYLTASLNLESMSFYFTLRRLGDCMPVIIFYLVGDSSTLFPCVSIMTSLQSFWLKTSREFLLFWDAFKFIGDCLEPNPGLLWLKRSSASTSECSLCYFCYTLDRISYFCCCDKEDIGLLLLFYLSLVPFTCSFIEVIQKKVWTHKVLSS